MRKANHPFALPLLVTCLCATSVGCETPGGGPTAPPPTPSSTESGAPASAATPESTKVAKIVFVGKQEACDCTRKAIDTSLAALEKVLGTPPKVPVEQLRIDVDEAQVEPYRQQKPIMTLPAIYLLDSAGSIVEQLQGEVTAEQIARALASPAAV